MIELLHISKRFGGVRALDDVSLALAPGERVALVGENGAGKTSLMNVLYGLYQPDAGSIRFDGAEARLSTPKDALARGVGMVHQHFTLVPTLSVAENVVLGSEPRRGLFFDALRAEREVQATARRFGFSLDARALVGGLTVGSQQKVEIVKALHRGVKTLVLDEPTAVLTPQEADELFAVTRTLSEAGLTVVLISHKLKEVLAFATRVAVMRKGALVKEAKAQETSAAELARWMVGEGSDLPVTLSGVEGGADLPFTLSPSKGAELAAPPSAPVALETRALAARPRLADVTLSVRAGEILGIAGVDGNGQRELAEVLTGLRAASGGTFSVLGQPATHRSPRELRERGLAHIPEDRLRHAIVPALTVEENVSLGRQASAPFAKGPWVDFPSRRTRTVALLEAHDVRPRAPLFRMGGLSGGNQQKLVVGRELDGAPKVLIAVQPTRGLDIAAVAAVRRHLLEAKAGGCAILLVSLDLDEVLELSDRVVTMFEGRLTGEFTRGEYDERVLGRRMLGVKDA